MAGTQGEELFGRAFISMLILVALWLRFLTLVYSPNGSSQGTCPLPAGCIALHTCFKMNRKVIILVSTKELHCSESRYPFPSLCHRFNEFFRALPGACLQSRLLLSLPLSQDRALTTGRHGFNLGSVYIGAGNFNTAPPLLRPNHCSSICLCCSLMTQTSSIPPSEQKPSEV